MCIGRQRVRMEGTWWMMIMLTTSVSGWRMVIVTITMATTLVRALRSDLARSFSRTMVKARVRANLCPKAFREKRWQSRLVLNTLGERRSALTIISMDLASVEASLATNALTLKVVAFALEITA